MPTFYMNDYSVLGLEVYPWKEAIDILEKNRFGLVRGTTGIDVVVEGPGQVLEIFQILQSHAIQVEIADVVNEIYQG